MEKKLIILTMVLIVASLLLVGMAWIQVGMHCPFRYLHYFVATPFFFVLLVCIALKVQKTEVIDTAYAILNRPVTALVKKISSLSIIGTSLVVTGSLMVLFFRRMRE
jgi:hypothetical protein